MRKGRIHLGLVHSSEHLNGYWELRVMEDRGTAAIVKVKLTPEQFSGLMASHVVTDVELE